MSAYVQDLPTEASLHQFIAQTSAAGDSPIAIVEFYTSFSKQWAASTVYQNQRIISHFSEAISQGTVIFGRIDSSLLKGIKDFHPDMEVSYMVYWQGRRQVGEVDALAERPYEVITSEVEVLLGLRAQGVTMVPRGTPVTIEVKNRRRWPTARPVVRQVARAEPPLFRRAPRR